LSIELLIAIGISIALLIIIFMIAGKRIESGYDSKARDGDGDGIIQEGTKWERPAGTVKIVPKAAPKKKAPAKKTPAPAAKKVATPAKKTTVKKAAPKKK
jgi:hypothetical protein